MFINHKKLKKFFISIFVDYYFQMNYALNLKFYYILVLVNSIPKIHIIT